MKRTPIVGIASALFLAAALALGGCGGDPASISSPSSPSSPSSSDSSVSSTAAPSSDNTSEPTSAVTSSIIVPGTLTKEQAIEVTKDVVSRTDEIYYLTLMYPSLIKADSGQTIPEEPGFWLVTDERFRTKADLRAYTETAYTPAYVDKYFSHIFNENDKDSGFLEYNGRLYIDSHLGGIGNMTTLKWESLRILSQEEDSLTIEIDRYLDDGKIYEISGIDTYSMKITENIWRLDNKSSKSVNDAE